MKVKILVLVTGERVIAGVEELPSGYLVNDPFIIVYRGDQNGNITGAGLQPFVLGSSGSCTIKNHQIITTMDAAPALEKQYAATTSVLQTPPPNTKMLLLEKK